MFHKVEEVKPMKRMTLRIKFKSGEVKIYDIEPLIKDWKVFERLQDRDLFLKVKVDVGGYGISWNDEIDLSCNELWKNGVLINK